MFFHVFAELSKTADYVDEDNLVLGWESVYPDYAREFEEIMYRNDVQFIPMRGGVLLKFYFVAAGLHKGEKSEIIFEDEKFVYVCREGIDDIPAIVRNVATLANIGQPKTL